MKTPRVLVVSPSVFNNYSGGGVLLTNLFRGWPMDSLATVHGDPLPVDHSVCDRFFRVGTDEIHWAWPLSLLQGKNRSPESTSTAGDGLRLKGGESGLRKALKRAIAPEFPWDSNLSPRLTAWIEEFRPEVIYVLPGGAYMRLATAISDRWNIPVVAHVMDDWPSVPLGGLFGGLVLRRLRRDFRRLLSRTAIRLSISEPMAAVYRERYGSEFQVFQNPADLSERLPHVKRVWAAGTPFRVVYIGSILHLSQLKSLCDVAAAVESLHRKGHAIRLDIYSMASDSHADELRAGAAVGLNPACGEEDVFRTLTSADLLVLPVNFDAASRRYIRFSMPAKIPLYLISGTPILVYGPPDVASVQYAGAAGWGEVVSRQSGAELEAAILKLMGDSVRREQLGRRGIEVAIGNHDAAAVRARFQEQLRNAVSS